MGDFNDDGKLDLVVANVNNNTVSVLLGTGSGTFGAKTDFNTGSQPISVAVGDFNGDGKLDLAVANEGGNTVSILLGNGDGTFGAKTDFATGTQPLSVAVGDFNGDGKLDLAVTTVADNTVSILLGTGTGVFGASTEFATGSGPESVVVGDFNGDGKPDLAVSNFFSNTVSILLGTGTGTFGAKTDFGTGSNPFTVAVGDFNDDGKLDLAVVNDPGPSASTVSVLLGNGDGTFGAKTDFITGNDPESLAVGDFNGDGKLDLAVGNVAGGPGNTVSILLGTGTGTFGAKTDFITGNSPISVAVGDFNRDGKLDIVTANETDRTVSILLNASPGPATSVAITQVNGGVNPQAGVPFSVVVQSQDVDGIPSPVVADTSVVLSLTTGTGTLGGTLTSTITAGTNSVTISGVTYSKIESGVVITATRTSGDSLAAGNSAPFNVGAPTPVFTDPGGNCGVNLPCFSNIQTAINTVASGGVVNIGPGVYSQDVDFNATAVTYNLSGATTLNAVTLTSGTVVAGSSNLTVQTTWTNNGGTFNGGTGTLTFTGTTIGGAQTTTFNNLTINAGATVTLSQDETVNGVLTLTTDLDTTSFTLTMPNTASSSGTGDVIGTVNRTGFISGEAALSFGNPFNTISIDSGTAPSGITVKLTETVPTDSSTGQTNSGFPNAVARTYIITPTGGSGISATVKLHYKTGDLNGNTEASLNLWRFDSGTGKWNNMGASGHNTTNHAVTQSGITQFSPWTLNSIVPTAAKLEKFTATSENGGVDLEWNTGYEVNNLGFNIYRQQNGERVKINPSLIAGTALMVGGGIRVESGLGYNWQDNVIDNGASYWLEEVDLNGASTWHGPFGITAAPVNRGKKITRTRSVLLNNLNAATRSSAIQSNSGVIIQEYPANFADVSNSQNQTGSITNGRTPSKSSLVSSTLSKQWSIASKSALKIAINKSGWYHLNMADLMAAGLSTNANPQTLQMFAGGTEIPIRLSANNTGLLSPGDSIEFYGSAIDTATTNNQVYWLVSGLQTGKRISIQQSPGSANNPGATSFAYTVERKDRSLYFSSLLNGDAENWFGSVISSNPVSESLTVRNLNQNSASQAEIEIALQGVTTNSHQVNVMLNGSAIQSISFDGMTHQVQKISIPQSSLMEGDNQITFAAQGSGDISLIDYVRITYAHSYAADGNALFTSVAGMQPVQVTGFTSDQIRAIDVANPNQPIEVEGTIAGDAGNYLISIGPAKRRNLLVFTPDQMLQPVSITAHQPSSLNKGGNGADYLIVTCKEFAQSIQPFAAFKQSQGYQVSVVDVEDIFDEFSYGVHTPQAIKDFFNWTYLHWSKQPQYVLLAGSGSLDPKGYEGLGNLDFVPTKLIDTGTMETASDDWLVDFNNDGKPQMSIGRLPVRTATEASDLINKIINYEQSGITQGAVLVSDVSDNADFNTPNNQLRAMLPSQMSVATIVRGQTNTDAKTELMDQLSQGGKIVNYAGHGSVNLWRGNLLTSDDIQTLANQKASPLIVTMTCLNGYFIDPRLAEPG